MQLKTRKYLLLFPVWTVKEARALGRNVMEGRRTWSLLLVEVSGLLLSLDLLVILTFILKIKCVDMDCAERFEGISFFRLEWDFNATLKRMYKYLQLNPNFYGQSEFPVNLKKNNNNNKKRSTCPYLSCVKPQALFEIHQNRKNFTWYIDLIFVRIKREVPVCEKRISIKTPKEKVESRSRYRQASINDQLIWSTFSMNMFCVRISNFCGTTEDWLVFVLNNDNAN